MLTEAEAQELMDHFVMKLRMVRHLRTPEYNELFGGDPTWITEAIGGMGDGRPNRWLRKTPSAICIPSINLGTAARAQSDRACGREHLPEAFKQLLRQESPLTPTPSSMKTTTSCARIYGDDYAIACCVSAMKVGKQMQFFGARCNLAKPLLYAHQRRHGRKEGRCMSVPGIEPITDEVLDYQQGAEKLLQGAGLCSGAVCGHHQYHPLYAR